jgi:hypothetical protein
MSEGISVKLCICLSARRAARLVPIEHPTFEVADVIEAERG